MQTESLSTAVELWLKRVSAFAAHEKEACHLITLKGSDVVVIYAGNENFAKMLVQVTKSGTLLMIAFEGGDKMFFNWTEAKQYIIEKYGEEALPKRSKKEPGKGVGLDNGFAKDMPWALPWKLEDPQDRRKGTIKVLSSSFRPIAHVVARSGEDSEALARLIASSGEMYSALKQVLLAGSGLPKELKDHCEAIIRKIEGEKSE